MINIKEIVKDIEKIDDVIWANEEKFLKRFAPGGFELLDTSFTVNKCVFHFFTDDYETISYDCELDDLQKWINSISIGDK